MDMYKDMEGLYVQPTRDCVHKVIEILDCDVI